MNKPSRTLICIALAVLCLPVFFSCSNHAEEHSIAAVLDQIDVLINQSQFKDAERELSKIEKKSFSSWTEIGIFRRYVQIGKTDKAEKIMLKALKKNPENAELNAVYTNFLLRNGRTEEALKAGKILQGSKYGSIYSEVVFKNVLEKSRKEELKEIFRSAEYYPVYYDAYTGSKEPFWLRNCALLRLASGAYERASSIHPSEIVDSADGYFWSLVMYDAQRYGDAVFYAEDALKYLNAVTGKSRYLVSSVKLSSILQDSYTWIGDAASAEEIRKKYLDSITDYRGTYILPDEEESSSLLSVIFVNSAKWSRDSEDNFRCVKLLSFSVENWPDYVPALTAYADFAYNSSLQRKEDITQLQLRDQGLASLEMEKYDRRAKIPLTDAIARIDDSLGRYKDPLLFIVRMDLRYKTEKKLTEAEKIADIWQVLEKNALAPSVYPDLLLQYALNFFLEKNKFTEAWELFFKYISAKYSISTGTDFWTNVCKKIYTFTLGEAEYAFYFATLGSRVDDSIRLGEYVVFENAENNQKQYVTQGVSDKTAMNLAMIYNSLGRKKDSIDLYSKVNGRSSEKALKSLIMYRMALIYLDAGDIKNARQCAEYSLTLNNRNAEAKLLLFKIKVMQ